MALSLDVSKSHIYTCADKMNAKRMREQFEETDERHNSTDSDQLQTAGHDDTASDERPRKKERTNSVHSREDYVAMPLPAMSRSCILRSLEWTLTLMLHAAYLPFVSGGSHWLARQALEHVVVM